MNKLKSLLEERKKEKNFLYLRGEVMKEMKEEFSGVSYRYPPSPRDLRPLHNMLSLTLCWVVQSWGETKEYLLIKGKKDVIYLIRKK